ncbi:hypothetical protein [Sinimarinibacterium thermocellulolyticum]|uniref:hypothetical protein n=1 Tax=Sinimarinibacterium thermocellulolyticum TaxID=3170016 RepID=UPI003DA09C4A
MQDYWRKVRAKLAPRFAPGRIKQWLKALSRSYPQAEQLFDALRREQDCRVIDRMLGVDAVLAQAALPEAA